MNNLSARALAIIEILKKLSHPVSSLALSEEIGCSTKKEFRKAIKTLTEQKSKSAKKTNAGVKEIQKGPVLIKKKPPTDNKGYVNTLTLIFVITSLIAITYILLSIK